MDADWHGCRLGLRSATMFKACMRCINDQSPMLMVGCFETEVAVGDHERLVTPWSTRSGQVDRLVIALDRLHTGPFVPS